MMNAVKFFDDAQIFQEPSVTPVQKTPWHNLCFDELNDVVFSLLQLIYSNIPNNPFCFMDFLPSSPQDVGRMSTDIIHSIVTCLECELARVKTSNSTPDNKSATYLAESDKLSSLIKELKKKQFVPSKKKTDHFQERHMIHLWVFLSILHLQMLINFT